MVGRMATAWLITLPAAALVGGLAAWAASTSTLGLIIVAVLALAAGLGFLMLARRNPVTHADVANSAGSGEELQPAGAGAAAASSAASRGDE
jgi:PiT family inorganic phosphate transporter